MSEYQVPREVVTRLEFLPGFSWTEMAALGAAVAVGFACFKLAGLAGIPGGVAFGLFVGPPALVFVALMGGQYSLWRLLGRFHWFRSRSQRQLYRTGAGMRRAASDVRKSAPAAMKGSVQEWLPVADLVSGLLLRPDGHAVAIIAVEPLNLWLKSPAEQHRIVSQLHEVVNSLQYPAQFLSLFQPLDLNDYVADLEATAANVDPTRQPLVKQYVTYVKGLLLDGETYERRYYILLPQLIGKGDAADALPYAQDVVSRLRQAELHARVVDEVEMLNILYVWGQPAQAAFERSPAGPPSVTTLLKEE